MTCYLVTVNRPGFLPDSDPVGCESLDDAREALASEILYTDETTGPDPDRDAVAHAIATAEALAAAETLEPDQSVTFAGYAYSITESAEAF